MNLYLKSNKHPSWPMRSSEVIEALGIEGNRLPVRGMTPRNVQNILVWVEPLTGELEDRRNSRRVKRSGHRVMAQCPKCGKNLSAGRLHQHSKVHS